MPETLLLTRLEAEARTAEVMAQLDPAPMYEETFQPRYENQGALKCAVYELHTTHPATSPRRIDNTLSQLGRLAEGRGDPLGISGRCTVPIRVETPIAEPVAEVTNERAIAIHAFGDHVLFIPRTGPQATKPRSKGPAILPSGKLHYPHLGDGVNWEDESRRSPDPSRMVGMATFARDIRDELDSVTGVQIPIAHEALLMPYELSFVRTDPKTEKQYLLSSELVWGGVRTNGLESAPMKLLARVANPVGVKVGPNTRPGDIQKLVQLLNPQRIPGKLTFMLRIPPEHSDVLGGVLTEINDTAPESVLAWDTHGITRPGENGAKIRAVPEIITDIQKTAKACGRAGLMLHGVHLESMGDPNRLECVDRSDQLPTHPGNLDPQLNPAQLERVLGGVAGYLMGRDK